MQLQNQSYTAHVQMTRIPQNITTDKKVKKKAMHKNITPAIQQIITCYFSPSISASPNQTQEIFLCHGDEEQTQTENWEMVMKVVYMHVTYTETFKKTKR